MGKVVIRDNKVLIVDGKIAVTDAPCSCCNAGCTNPNSANYDPTATCDDGSCVTCCGEGLCRIGDNCKGLDCNPIAGAGGGCCDSGCLPCPGGDYRDCDNSFDNIMTDGQSFVATKCDGTQVVYYDCYDCPSGDEVSPPP